MRKVLLIATLFVVLLTACQRETLSIPTPIEEIVETDIEREIETETHPTVEQELEVDFDLGGPLNSWEYMSDYDYYFSYNGKEYHFPMTCTDFVTNAFSLEMGDLDAMVEPGMTEYIIARNGNAEFDVGVVNKSEQPLAVKDCNLLSVRVTSYPWEDINVDFVGPDGTALGSSYSRLLGDNLPAALDDKVEDGDGLVTVIENDNSGYGIGVISYDYAEDKCGQIFIEYYGE